MYPEVAPDLGLLIPVAVLSVLIDTRVTRVRFPIGPRVPRRCGHVTVLLDRAVAEARKLPDTEQDAIAALILQEIDDDRRWDEALAKSPGKLTTMAARAEEQVRAGRCRPVGFDER